MSNSILHACISLAGYARSLYVYYNLYGADLFANLQSWFREHLWGSPKIRKAKCCYLKNEQAE